MPASSEKNEQEIRLPRKLFFIFFERIYGLVTLKRMKRVVLPLMGTLKRC